MNLTCTYTNFMLSLDKNLDKVLVTYQFYYHDHLFV